MPDYQTESCVIKQSDDIEKEWFDLQQHANHSYFQSWGWIGTWLDLIAVDLQPIAVKVWFDECLVGIGLFVSRDVKRRGIFRSRAMYLNEYPFDSRNMTIEYNGLLAARGHENSVYNETANYLLKEYKEFDEFYFGAVAENSDQFNPETILNERVNCIVYEESVCRYIDLTKLSPGIDGYLTSLSRNRRSQIRRSMRVYEQGGTLQIDEAHNTEQALLYLDRLKTLHSNYWQSRDKSGSFANPIWENFHRTLILRRFSAGEVQLLKISNDHGEIGYIYNVVLHKHVYVIQTGFICSKDKRLLPGYVAHTLAIAYTRSMDMLYYDLMHGDDLYKRILCNRSRKLLWVVIQRKRTKFAIENAVAGFVRNVRKLVQRKN